MQVIREVFHCKKEQFRITYFGITVKPEKLAKQEWFPLLGCFEKNLEGWKGKYFSLGEGGYAQCATFFTTAILYVVHSAKVGQRKN